MLTLDALARMAERMPSEGFGETGVTVYRRPDRGLRVRYVTLPSVAEEQRRALALFTVAVGATVGLVTLVGVATTHSTELAAAAWPSLGALARTALWFAGWTAALLGPFCAIGLVREVRRYRRVRSRIGAAGWLASDGTLCSDDGSVSVSVRDAPSARLRAPEGVCAS